MPVKLSDALVVDARTAGAVMARSISGQVEFWARLGRGLEPLLNGVQATSLAQRGLGRPLAELLASVDAPEGQTRLAAHLETLPFPHYAPHPERPGLLLRAQANGTTDVGRFVQRVFCVVDDT